MDIATILEREDIKYALKQKEIYYKEYYRKLYGYRYISFFDNFALNWMHHRTALKEVQKNYDLTHQCFEILLGHNLMAAMWDINGLSGHYTVYEAFFKDNMSKNTYNKWMQRLRALKYIQYVLKHQVRGFKRERMLMVKIPNDRVVKLGEASHTIVKVYNTEMGIQFNKTIKSNPALLENINSTIDKLILMRDELASKNDILKGIRGYGL
jgi:hypothetical protein